jgi:homoserine kinase type II
MARLTAWPLEEAEKTLAPLGIELQALEPLAAGSVNSNFRLQARDGRVLFARIYEEQPPEGARAELELLAELAAAGVPTPRPIGPLVLYAGKAVAVFPWIEGTIRCQAAVTADDCRALGSALASVHRAPVSRIPAGRFGISDLQQRLDRIEREAGAELANAARQIRAKLESYAARRDPELPSGLIHGDLFRDNVLWQGTSIAALIDFESASAGSYLYDLLVTVQAWCFSDRFEPELCAGLISGYDALRPLSDAEIACVPVEAALGALRFATTRITDYSLRAAPGHAPVRDYRRFLARLDAIEHGALSAAVARLR